MVVQNKKINHIFNQLSVSFQNQIKALDERVISPAWSDENWDSCDLNYLIYFSNCDEGKILGFILIYYHEGSGQAELLKIAVYPEHQERGIGQSLFDFMLKDLKQMNLSTIFLEVRESNHRAIKFYQKNKFGNLRVIKDYYGKNKNALAMKRVI